jgi:hypothetical protein
MTRTLLNNYIGTGKWFLLPWMARRKRERLLSRTRNASCRVHSASHPVFVSITRIIGAGADLHAGLYSGQVGPVYIEPKHEPGSYDREVFSRTQRVSSRLSVRVGTGRRIF